MKLLLVREIFTDESTIGKLYVNGRFECYTLEDKVRAVKVPRQTAIPAGRYRVILNHSTRFQRIMPLLLNVRGFEGIRIHPGNTAANTDGCILVGQVPYANHIGASRVAYNALFNKMQAAWLRKESFEIEIRGGVISVGLEEVAKAQANLA